LSESITRLTIIEVMQDMAQEIENISSMLYSAVKKDKEGIEKLYRQELLLAKEKISRARDRIFDYLANGRLEVLPYKEFYINSSLQLENAVNKFDAGVYRLILLQGAQRDAHYDEVNDTIVYILEEIYNSSRSLVDLLRSLLSVRKASSEKRKMIEEKFSRIADSESRVDSIYRSGLAKILEFYKAEPSKLLLLKDAIEYLEDSMDCIYSSSVYIKLIGISWLT